MDWLIIVVVIAGFDLNILLVLALVALGLIATRLALAVLLSFVGRLFLFFINNLSFLDKLIILLQILLPLQIVPVDLFSEVANSDSGKKKGHC